MNPLSGKFGYRGAWLLILGTVWVLFGVGVIVEVPEPRPWVLYEYLPQWTQAAGWWITGGIAIWQGARGPACPDRPDVLGHVALYLMPALRMVSFALAFLLWLGSRVAVELSLTHHVIGFREGWYAAFVWAFVVVMLHHAASWPEPHRPIPRPPVGAAEDE